MGVHVLQRHVSDSKHIGRCSSVFDYSIQCSNSNVMCFQNVGPSKGPSKRYVPVSGLTAFLGSGSGYVLPQPPLSLLMKTGKPSAPQVTGTSTGIRPEGNAHVNHLKYHFPSAVLTRLPWCGDPPPATGDATSFTNSFDNAQAIGRQLRHLDLSATVHNIHRIAIIDQDTVTVETHPLSQICAVRSPLLGRARSEHPRDPEVRASDP